MAETDLDRTHTAMEAGGGAARLGFYHALADAQLFLLLLAEPEGDDIAPQTYEVDGVAHALAFDTEERLAEFTGAAAPYAALPGRVLAGMLAGAGVGLGLNLGVAPSSILLPPEALTWLNDTLGQGGGAEAGARPDALTAPGNVPQAVLAALDAKLARAGGLASHACLAGSRYAGGETGHLLIFIGAALGAETALTRAVSEALTFSGIEAGTLDVGFAEVGSALAQRIERVGLRFDLPAPEAPQTLAAPGSDPSKPPKLR
ncbi:SseB family protein [Roseovarius dicentrarchi]|uniref:SseB family protein n=1 Tax=Roseovarius dicentrarchi TaxID=2250573 RepID=UPI000DE9E9BE|nr:SseB family protein [Roseovarius dicentrarchi]